MKVTTKQPEPVKPNVVIELTYPEANEVYRVLDTLPHPSDTVRTLHRCLGDELDRLDD